MLEPGQNFPHFHLPNQNGEERTLQSYLGKWLVLYVYPKDDTPGCTIQGQSFSATKEQFDSLNTIVVGLSADDVQSHKTFCEKYNLTVELLADPKAFLLEKMGVGQKTFRGSLYWNRTTFIVDPKGTVRKVFSDVDPNHHEALILKTIKELQA